MKIVLHQSWEELQSAAAEWNRLLAQSCSDTIFLTWEWCEAWWHAYGHGRSLCVLTAWENNQLVGVAPFYADTSRSWRGKWTCLRIIGAGSGDSDYLDCFTKLGLERQVLALFFEFLESVDKGWDWIEIEGAPHESSCLAAIGKIAAERGWSFACEDVPCATLSLPRQWDDYLRLLRPRVRTKIRSALAYFEQLDIEPTECTASHELDNWLAQLFDIHTRRWQKRRGPGVFRSEDRQSFYREVSRTALQKGWLAFHRLTWCDRPLALQYGFRYHNHLYSLQEGYDPAFEKLRPGVALRGWIMRYEIQQGLTEYDFLAGTARHKLEWGDHTK
jgi:CelD/BcsL family acetyltransferase involved in cellulose biosynthesis